MALTDQKCQLTARGEGEGYIIRCCEFSNTLGFVRGKKDNGLESTVENKDNLEIEKIGT